MKAIKLLSIAIVLLIIASCSSVFSPVGDKTTDLNTKCDNCSHTRNYYKAYGEAEIVSGPRVKMAAISQARTYARNELVKMLGTEGMNIAAQIAETKMGTEFVAISEPQTEERPEPLVVIYGNYEIKLPEHYKPTSLKRLLDVLEARNVH